MTEDEARVWLNDFGVSRETMSRFEALRLLLVQESEKQNLVSPASLAHFWARHIVDSMQLAWLAPSRGPWIDLGSGAGFPGLIVAAVREGPMVLVEERRLRAEFLHRAVACLEISHKVTIVQRRVERLGPAFYAVISARAFAPLPKLLALAAKFADSETVWVLPKGRNAQSELEAVAGSWQGAFRLVPSITAPEAQIIVARGVRPIEGERR